MHCITQLSSAVYSFSVYSFYNATAFIPSKMASLADLFSKTVRTPIFIGGVCILGGSLAYCYYWQRRKVAPVESPLENPVVGKENDTFAEVPPSTQNMPIGLPIVEPTSTEKAIGETQNMPIELPIVEPASTEKAIGETQNMPIELPIVEPTSTEKAIGETQNMPIELPIVEPTSTEKAIGETQIREKLQEFVKYIVPHMQIVEAAISLITHGASKSSMKDHSLKFYEHCLAQARFKLQHLPTESIDAALRHIEECMTPLCLLNDYGLSYDPQNSTAIPPDDVLNWDETFIPIEKIEKDEISTQQLLSSLHLWCQQARADEAVNQECKQQAILYCLAFERCMSLPDDFSEGELKLVDILVHALVLDKPNASGWTYRQCLFMYASIFANAKIGSPLKQGNNAYEALKTMVRENPVNKEI